MSSRGVRLAIIHQLNKSTNCSQFINYYIIGKKKKKGNPVSIPRLSVHFLCCDALNLSSYRMFWKGSE